MKRYLKIGITGAAILASGILCAFVLFKMPVIISVLKGITEILKPFLYGVVFAYLLAPLCNKIEEKLKQVFRPEFLNRIDEIIVFDSLTKTELLQIVELMLKDTVKALADKNISLNVSENAKDFILEKGTNLKYGARPLRRAIQRYVEDEISEMILKGDVHDGQTINVDIENNELKFNIE